MVFVGRDIAGNPMTLPEPPASSSRAALLDSPKQQHSKRFTMKSKTVPYLLIALSSFALAGCPDEGPAEEFGEEMDQAVDEVQDSVEEAGDEIEDAVDGDV